MGYKFEKLEVWRLALDYAELMYDIAGRLPDSERFNLKSQIERAATSVALNIAEGSMGQSDAEQSKFIGYAIRSVVETVACQHLVHRRGYIAGKDELTEAYLMSQTVTKKLYSLRKSLDPNRSRAREEVTEYGAENGCPFIEPEAET